MSNHEFIADIFELVFGEDADKKGFTYEEALKRLRYFSEMSAKFEEYINEDIIIEGLGRKEYWREELKAIEEDHKDCYIDYLNHLKERLK